MLSLYIVDLHIAVNNVKPLGVTMEMQEWVLFALWSSYKVFLTAVNTINVLRSSCKVSDIVVQF
jgi:hypothetical protein